MSIYATTLTIEDERQVAAELEAVGIGFGVITDEGEVEDLDTLDDELLDAPIIYQGSHVLPHNDDPRGGSVDTALIPGHITRDGRDDASDENSETPKPWLRLGVSEHKGPHATVVLTRRQVSRLRDDLDRWLNETEAA